MDPRYTCIRDGQNWLRIVSSSRLNISGVQHLNSPTIVSWLVTLFVCSLHIYFNRTLPIHDTLLIFVYLTDVLFKGTKK
jgi:hypothetical protein